MNSSEQIPSADTEPPTQTTIERLRQIWCEALEIETVRDDDNFIEIGGDSIAATLCLNRIRAVFGVALPIIRLFEEGMTLASLSEAIERSRYQHEADA